MERSSSSRKPHVLIVPYPAQGHINPMLQFAKRLISKGLRATLAATVNVSDSMHAAASFSSIPVATISDGHDDGGYSKSKSPEDYLAKLRDVGSRTLTDLLKKLEDSGDPVDLLVYDGFLPWALDVGEKFGIAGAVFFTQSCAVNSLYYHVYKGHLSLPFSGSGPVVVPGLPPLAHRDTPSFLYNYGSYPGFFDMVVNQFSNVDRADWVLFNTFYELEPEVLDWMSKLWRARTVGPTLPSMYLDKRLQDDSDYDINLFKPDSAACLNWLSDKPTRSVVYVSFGSLADLEAEQTEQIALALIDAGFNFLWVVRASEQRKLPENFAAETKEKGLVVGWAPQLEVLSHDSLGCFVTHCGFNSVLEAVGLGVAVVGVPQWTDQGTNAKFVEEVWGVGVRAKKDEKGMVGRGELAARVREVMGGERGREIKEAATRWKKLAVEAADEGGSSDKNIDEIVAVLRRS